MSAAPRVKDRAAAVFLLAVLAVGCVGLFLGVPVGVLWSLSQLTDSFVTHFVLGLVGIPLAIVVLAPALFWVNALYLRVTAPPEPEDEWEEEELRQTGGPLEPMLVVAFVIAAIAFAAWFLLLAENPVLTT